MPAVLTIGSAVSGKYSPLGSAKSHSPKTLPGWLLQSNLAETQLCGAFNPGFDFAAERPEIDRLGQKSFGAVLQRMSGLELLPKAKAMRPDVPIIMITAYGDAETKRKAIDRARNAPLNAARVAGNGSPWPRTT